MSRREGLDWGGGGGGGGGGVTMNGLVQMGGNNVWFQRELRKIICQLSPNTPII